MDSRRNRYPAKFKLKVVEYAEKTNNCAAAREFNTTESNVRNWRKLLTKLRQMPKNKCANRGKKNMWPQLEDEVHKYVCETRQDGHSVSRGKIRIFAMQEAKKMNIVNFKASAGWCTRFMKRHDLVLRQKTKIAQRLPAELAEKVSSFQRFIIKHRKKNEYRLACIGNMDETPMNFDMPAGKTVNKMGEKTVLVKTTGHEKSRFTVVLTCMADGTKLKPMVIFKRKTLPKQKFPKGVVVHVHEKGWMDEQGLKIWLKQVWCSRPGGLRKEKSLLVWDMFKCHLMDSVVAQLRSQKTDIAVIPGGLTSIVQPLDVCLNKPFKDYMRDLWSNWMIEGEKTFTKGGSMRAPTLETLCEWIVQAWGTIRLETVVYSFKKCSISNALDGTEDDILWDENVSDAMTEDEEAADDPMMAEDDDPYDDQVRGEDWDTLFGNEDDDEEQDFHGF